MTTDFVAGRITQFRREQGFGTITLADGRELPFDASACSMVPEENAPVLVQVGKARWGNKDKAVLVKPAEPSTSDGVPTLTIDQQVGRLHAHHLVAGLTEEVLNQIVNEVYDGDASAATLLGVLDAYYTADPARAVHDGYLRHDWRFGQETDDVLAEIAALVPGVRLPRQLRWTQRDTTERGHQETISTLHFAHPDGREDQLDIGSLDDIGALVNRALREAGAPQRLYALETEGDWHAYFVLTRDRATALAALLPFASGPDTIS